MDYTKTNKEQEEKKNILLRLEEKETQLSKIYALVNQKGLLIYKTKNKQKDPKYDYRVYKNNLPYIP